jgi:hypothetical protein
MWPCGARHFSARGTCSAGDENQFLLYLPLVQTSIRGIAMAVDHIRYDILAQEALRGVVRQVLVDAAKNGLPGEHHFFITFDTTAEGVEMSPRMRAQYPTEMTVVLQHQFWDLTVSEGRFSVGLSFGGVAEKLVVPFPAIKGFADPSVKFGLQFTEANEGADAEVPDAKDRNDDTVRAPTEMKRTRPAIAAVPKSKAAPAAPDDGPDKPDGSGVVRLDRFRKKK